MTRIVCVAIVGALVVEASHASAQPTAPVGGSDVPGSVAQASGASTQPAAPVAGSDLPRSELAVELGLVKSFLQRTRRFGDAQSSGTELELGTAEAASWLFRFSKAWWFGPRLGAEQYFNFHDGDYSHTAHAGGMLLGRPGESTAVHPRVMFGLAVAWEHLSRPSSFEIEQQINSAFGPMWMAGIGIERIEHGRAIKWLRWSLDLSVSQCSFGHEHTMLDTRTNERVTERVQVSRDNIMLQLGVGWFPGG